MFTHRMKYLWLLLLVPIAFIAMFTYEASLKKQKEVEEQLQIARQKQEAERGDSNAQVKLGDYYGGTGKDDKEAVRWYRKAADQGNAEAQCFIGSMYLHGDGVAQNYAEALKWCKKAADQGHAKGQYQIGFMYDAGLGVTQDYAEAASWYKKAADQGNQAAEEQLRIARQKQEAEEQRKTIDALIESAKSGSSEAQKELGNAYYYGQGIKINLQEAEYWWEKAANQDNVAAQFNIGTFYLHDILHQDLNKAVSWLEKATANGDKDAPEQLRIAKQKKEALEQVEAEKRVKSIVKGEDNSGDLMEAASNGNLEEVKRLLNKGVDVDGRDKDGDTSLMNACEKGNLRVVRLLLDKGADVNARGDDGSTSLIRACENEKIEVVKLLLGNKADVNVKARDGEIALICACDKRNLELAKLLLAKGADVNAKGESDRTPLIMACMGSKDKQLEMIKLLLKNGSDVNIKDNRDETALIHAAATDNPKIVKLLIDRGADVNAAGDLGYTVLMVAAQHDSPQVVKLILDKGADVNAKSEDGTTALMIASLHGNLQIAKLLLDRGADANAKNIDGRTVIQCASIRGHPEMVNLLNTYTANVFAGCVTNEEMPMYTDVESFLLMDRITDTKALTTRMKNDVVTGNAVIIKEGTPVKVIKKYGPAIIIEINGVPLATYSTFITCH